MCAISGSNNLEKAFALYKLNLQRGAQSSGMLAVGSRGSNVSRIANTYDEDYISHFKKQFAQSPFNYHYFLFHSRAPTNSTVTTWSQETTHPFASSSGPDYLVAHNGIITNFSSFEESKHLTIDSQIIPEHLSKTQNIVETFSKYEGLFTCWIVNRDRIQLVKAGSSLWMDENSFSSSKFEGAECVEDDGVIFDYKDGKFEKSGTFPYTNTYFI